ncbi:uncharacterized protein BDV17DRAFT_250038 [Aspergillus undulatus]|uniref:uncharacterized protein n=1 Tax=Aspergillus undulatus TaxID=1810928 RepID=UPI003CCD64DB
MTVPKESKDVKSARRSTTSCSECQRRKQKCSRTWPCNHCQGRKIAHLCKFTPKRAARAAKGVTNHTGRVLEGPEGPNDSPNSNPRLSCDIRTKTTQDDDLRSLGYLPETPDAFNDGAPEPTVFPLGRQAGICSEMESALRVIPAKQYTDIIIHHFIDHTNYQYYALYPPAFMQDYTAWWSARANGSPLTPELTCLILRVCACSAPYLGEDIRLTIESELGNSIEQLSLLYHNTAKRLSATIIPGKGGLIQVQQLFLTAQWCKTEALFVEAWHALGAAVHEAQEQGMHRSSAGLKFSDFDREMRRRLWFILYAWDWQMSLLLSRPFIINSSCCVFEQPDSRLESVDSDPETLSPVTHMVLQCQLGLSISKIPGVMSGNLSVTQAMAIQQEAEKWFNSFPAVYSISNPDTRWDSTHHFIKVQRFQLHAIGYMIMLMPLKQCLTKDIDPDSDSFSSSIERGLQATAVQTALRLLRACEQLLRHILPLNAKFYFAPFLMFDTASLLCSAILHDTSGTLPQRERVLEAISETVAELGMLSERARTGMICYKALKKLVSRLPPETLDVFPSDPISPQSPVEVRSTLPNIPGTPAPSSCFTETASSAGVLQDELAVSFPASLDSLPPHPLDDNKALADLYEMDLGELSHIWDWGNLEIDFPDIQQEQS